MIVEAVEFLFILLRINKTRSSWKLDSVRRKET